MYKFSTNLSSELKKIVHHSDPLGPIDIADVENQKVQKILFDSENKIFKNIIKHPSIIVGRRGSGKTTFLKSLVHEKSNEAVIIEITCAKAFQQVVIALQDNLKGNHIFAESVAELWDWIFWTALLSKVDSTINNGNRSNLTNQFWHGENFQKYLSILQKSKNDGVSILSKILSSKAGYSPENLQSVKDATNESLDSENTKAFILLDSLENYQLETDGMELAISGLLKAAGRFNQIRGNAEIRVCIPAELYHQFRKYSSNSIKDFRHLLILHWHAGELLSLSAHRYRLYLNLYPENIPPDILSDLNGIDIHTRDGAIGFWNKILPDHIINAVGLKENPIAYILRHTQLLPRQIIFLVNTICRWNHRQGGKPYTISGEAIVAGVEASEAELWLEVCNAYQGVYPEAEKIIRAIVGELPLVFEEKTLRAIFNRHGKSALIDRESMDFFDFKKMLIEIGFIGAVIEQESRYTTGVFEYTEGQVLHVSTSTKLCLHPLFCGGEKTHSLNGLKRVIYPYGSDPQGKDRRDL